MYKNLRKNLMKSLVQFIENLSKRDTLDWTFTKNSFHINKNKLGQGIYIINIYSESNQLIGQSKFINL